MNHKVHHHHHHMQDWAQIPVPANAGEGNVWELQDNVSDDFNYSFESTNSKVNFGDDKWYNFYHNHWDGPGYTYWKHGNVTVEGGNLVIEAGYTSETNKGGTYGVASGCVTSNAKVVYPVYVESAISVANISLASCFWLLSPDDTEEIDIIENYGNVNFYKQYTHISHHSFIRQPFTDYQPRDWNSWYPDSRVNNNYGWGDWCWNEGQGRRYMRMGVYWKSPKHFEYYIDGELIRVMYYNAIATNYNGTWEYTYFKSLEWEVNGYKLPTNISSGAQNGYTDVIVHSTSSSFDFDKLKEASNASNGHSVIDPAWFQGGDDNDDDNNGVTVEARGFTKEMDIIINVESQGWLLDQTPSESDLNNKNKNQMRVDWVRVYKPVTDNGGVRPVLGIELQPSEKTLGKGNKLNLSPIFSPSNATNQNVTFTSNNENVATVNDKGVVSGVDLGEALITVTSEDGGFTSTSKIIVIENGKGSEFIIEAEDFTSTGGTFDDGEVPFGMFSNDIGVNFVNKEDWAEYTVTVPEAGNYSITYLISTPMDNANISIFDNDTQIGESTRVEKTGGWETYENQTASFIAQLEAGETTFKILASGSDWQWNLDKIVFSPYVDNTIAVEDINIDQTSASIERYTTLQLTATIVPEDATNKKFTWSSSNAFVASIDENGLVTANSEGEVEIFATTEEGNIRAISKIMVTSASNIPVSGLTLSSYSEDIKINSSKTITATVLPSDASNKNVSWLSSDESVATVENGKIKGVSVGSCTITSKTEEGEFTQTISVNITADTPTSIHDLNNNSLVIYPNPNVGKFKIKGLEVGVYSIKVLNIYGSNVRSLDKVRIENEIEIDLTNVPVGIYIIQVTDGKDKKFIQRIIKE